MNMAGKARRAGRTCMGLLLGVLAVVLLLHAFVLALEALALAALTAAAIALILPGRWRTLRRQMTGWGARAGDGAAAWLGTVLSAAREYSDRAEQSAPSGATESGAAPVPAGEDEAEQGLRI